MDKKKMEKVEEISKKVEQEEQQPDIIDILLDEDNKDSFFTFVNYENEDKVTNAILEGVIAAYSAQHPVSRIILDDLTLESIAQFVELKHFETIYTGNILRRELGLLTSMETAMPEVLQPNVEKYKSEVRKAMAK